MASYWDEFVSGIANTLKAPYHLFQSANYTVSAGVKTGLNAVASGEQNFLNSGSKGAGIANNVIDALTGPPIPTYQAPPAKGKAPTPTGPIFTPTNGGFNDLQGPQTVQGPQKPEPVVPPIKKNSQGEAALMGKVSKALVANKLFQVNPPTPNQDMLLKAADFAERNVISPIFRSASTALLLSDKNSPLYQPGPYEKGFQLNDIREAWDRSAKVSAFDALTKSSLINQGPASLVFGPAKNAIESIGGPNIDKVNLFSDKSIKENYHDNIVGKWFTGGGDFALSFPIFSGVGKTVGMLGKVGAEATGLVAKGEPIVQMEKDILDGLKYTATNGAEGRATVVAGMTEKLAQTSDAKQILNVLSGFNNKAGITTNERLPSLIAGISDPAVIGDLLLADKGYLPAIMRLATKGNADVVAEAGYLDHILKDKALGSNGVYFPDNVSLPKIKQAFEDSIAKDPSQVKMRDALMNEAKNYSEPRFAGNDVFIREPKIGNKGREAIVSAKNKLADTYSNMETRNFESDPWISSTWFGSSRALSTRVVRLMGSRMPLGIVSFTGTRPFDHILETKAIFDSLSIFKNGDVTLQLSPNEFVKAGTFYKEALSKVAGSTTDMEKLAAHEQLNEQLGKLILHTRGIHDVDAQKQFISDLINGTRDAHTNFAEKGFAMDVHGAVTTDEITQRQLLQSYRYVDWAWAEKLLDVQMATNGFERLAVKTPIVAKQIIDDVMRLWSFSVLARPQFFIKNSWLEPLLTGTLGQGSRFITEHVGGLLMNMDRNNWNRFAGKVVAGFDAPARKEANRAVAATVSKLEHHVAAQDKLSVEWKNMFKKDVYSPKDVQQYGPLVAKQLREINDIVDKVELSYRHAMQPFGRVEKLPTVTNLQQRLDYLEQISEKTPASIVNANVSKLNKARQTLYDAENTIDVYFPNKLKVHELQRKIEDSYAETGKLLEQLGKDHLDQSAVYGKGLQYKERYMGRDSYWRDVNGQYMELPTVMGPDEFGVAFRGEVSNVDTMNITYAQELTKNVAQSIFARAGSRAVTKITDPLYYEQFAWMVNRYWRGDPLITQILQGKDFATLRKWSKTAEGKTYIEQFENVTPQGIAAHLRDVQAVVERYLPSEEAKALILKKQVKSVELQKALAPYHADLPSIQPLDFSQDIVKNMITKGGFANVERGLTNVTSRVFKALAKPENPIRQAYVDAKTQDIIAQKATVLAKQGAKVDLNTFNTLSQTAKREAVIDLEKTFYTQRRPSRALWALRPITAFPTATFNAFYRYGRLAIKQPVRTLGFLHYYDGAFRSFGVDHNGNPVGDNNVLNAEYIVVPGSGDIGPFKGTGVMLNARSIGFLLNAPNPTPLASIPVSWVMKKYPSTEATLQNVLGSSAYASVFPFGPNTSIGAAFTPAWLRDGIAWAQGQKGKTAFANSLLSVYNYHKTMADMKLEPMPSDEQILKETQKLYSLKATLEFASPAGVPIKINTTPFSPFEELFYNLVNKYEKRDKLPHTDAVTKAGEEFIATVGADFPLDMITFKGKRDGIYIPPTVEADTRFFHENKDLIQELQNINPKLVSLLGADIVATPENKNITISNKLKDVNTTLPTGLKVNGVKLTPQEVERQRLNARTWLDYNNVKDKLIASLITADSGTPLDKITPLQMTMNRNILASHPEAEKVLKDYANVFLRKQNPSWWESEYKNAQIGDSSWQYARALRIITTNADFMSKHGSVKLWQDAQTFIKARETFIKVYSSLPSGSEAKKALTKAWPVIVQSTLSQWDPNLQTIIKNYFSNDKLQAVE